MISRSILVLQSSCGEKRELIALLNLSSWCLVMVERLFLTVPRGCLQFVIVVFPDHTHLLFLFLCKTGEYDGNRDITSHSTIICQIRNVRKISFVASFLSMMRRLQ